MAIVAAIPEGLKQFAGRMMDVDSHEMIPAQEWVSVYGEDVRPLTDAWLASEETDAENINSPNVPGYPGDVSIVSADIGKSKGCRAPGAVDPERRVDVMDALGIKRQLMFSSYVGVQAMMLLGKDDPEFLKSIKGDRRSFAYKILNLYNEWTIAAGGRSSRTRPVPIVYANEPQELISMVQRLIKKGIRAIQIPAGILPGGRSPAHPDLDIFWSMVSEANCAVTLHIGGEGKFFESREWGNAPVFKGFRNLGEFTVDPWSLSILHMPFQNFVGTMVVGGVFDRHPNLRFGILEVGAHWIGPMMEALDFWYINSQAFKSNGAYRLPELPSSYVRRNVRVGPFVFEKVDELVEKYSLEDVLCFSTDYPHVEGGPNALELFRKKLNRFGPAVLEKFFVTNGEFLLPD